MGCDIHYVVEKVHNNKWIGLFHEHVNRDLPACSRNYAVFAELASVRGQNADGRTAIGMPTDASELAEMRCAWYDGDGHSHSYLSLREFCAAYDRAMTVPGVYAESPWRYLLNLWCDDEEDDSPDNYRVIFWFDN